MSRFKLYRKGISKLLGAPGDASAVQGPARGPRRTKTPAVTVGALANPSTSDGQVSLATTNKKDTARSKTIKQEPLADPATPTPASTFVTARFPTPPASKPTASAKRKRKATDSSTSESSEEAMSTDDDDDDGRQPSTQSPKARRTRYTRNTKVAGEEVYNQLDGPETSADDDNNEGVVGGAAEQWKTVKAQKRRAKRVERDESDEDFDPEVSGDSATRKAQIGKSRFRAKLEAVRARG